MKNDAQLQHDVIEELEWESSVDGAQIGVTAREGVVTLTGHVPVHSQKVTAEDVAKRVHGVRAVANEIEVRPPESHRRDDADLAAAVIHALKWDSAVPEDRIVVTVRDGLVTLEGTVAARFQRDAADRVVRHLRGVRKVNNRIVVQHTETSDRLKASLEDAFRRSATLDSKRLFVTAEHGKVILRGDVHSHAERDEAERIAWAAPGVRQVENCITITPWGYGPADEWGY